MEQRIASLNMPPKNCRMMRRDGIDDSWSPKQIARDLLEILDREIMFHVPTKFKKKAISLKKH